MTSKKMFLMASIVLSSSILLASNVLAKPTLTEQELAHARELATSIKIDFDLMLQEAEEWGIDCGNTFTHKGHIAICNNKIKNAKIQEETKQLIIQAGNMAREQLKKQSK